MALPHFDVTWDYRCPFARNAHEHLVAGLEAGADWDVTFVPFSLNQVHVPEGGTSVWEDEDKRPDLLALAAGVVVRDRMPERFLAAHRALFAARHDDGKDLRLEQTVAEALEGVGVPSKDVLDEIASGWPLDEVRKAHEHAATAADVWGVPTFVIGDRGVFVRLMTRPEGDSALARRTIERVVTLMDDAPEINEFKYTAIKR
jgi:predicted DsbA family dithiol-disulfide isomerase